jgi:hypothetical protein
MTTETGYRNAICIILKLLKYLPDSNHNDESWDWCWSELSDDAQEAVKSVRKLADRFLEDMENDH